MAWIRALLRGVGRAVSAFVLFFAMAIGWTAVLYAVNPWSAVQNGAWPTHRPIVVSSGATQQSRVILYRHLAQETDKDPTLVPWPATPEGATQDGHVHTAWKTVSGERWQFEVLWDDRDHVLESRYRLEGKTPVLVEARGRDPAIAFQGIVLAILTLVIWKTTTWWRRRRASSRQPVDDD